MTLAEMTNSGEIEPGETASNRQTGLPVEAWGHQPTFKNFDPEFFESQFFLTKRNRGENGTN